jgi:hypothetical protein
MGYILHDFLLKFHALYALYALYAGQCPIFAQLFLLDSCSYNNIFLRWFLNFLYTPRGRGGKV